MFSSTFLRSLLSAACVLFGAFTATTTAQTILKVGQQPLAIIPVGNTVHVFCNGNDMNFNSIYEPDSGDVAASWWIIDTQTRAVIKHREFTDRYLPFPFRIALSKETENHAYISNGNHISSFLVNSLELEKDTLAIIPDSLGNIYALSKSQGDALTLSCRKEFDKPGHIVGIDIMNGKILGVVPTFINTQQTTDFRNSINQYMMIVLNEGSYGSKNSTLQIFEKNLTSIDIPLGDGGNHIFYEGMGRDSLFVTVNGSHKVVIVDLIKKQIVKSIPTLTTGFNGPRESAVIGNKLFVTTYNSDVREFDIATGALVATLNSKGKPEGLTVINGKLWIANAFGAGSYTPDSTIAIFESPLAVEEYFTENKNIVFPNPALASATISTSFSGQANAPVAIELYSLTGTKLFSTSTTSGSYGEVNYALPIQDVSAGTYFVRVISGTMVQVTRLMKVAQ
ncbi:MAG: T9SS type A sorting domain-containing protein [Candidatus Kapaibacterium sp.]